MAGKVQKTVLVVALTVPLALAGDSPEAVKSLLDVPGVPVGVVAFDANGDARPDLAAWLDGGTRAVLLCNAGDGRFLPACALPDVEAASPSPYRQVVAADVDRDGDQDLVGAGAPSVLLRNEGAGTFVAEALPPEADGDRVVAAAAPGTAAPDLVVTREGGVPVVLVNDGGGHFTALATDASPAALLASSGPWANGTAVADFDGDTRPDLAAPTVTPQPGISVLLASAAVDADRPLVLLRGRIGDRAAPGGDRLYVTGDLPDALDPAAELRVSVAAGGAAIEATTAARQVSVDAEHRRFSATVDGIDLAAPPSNPVVVTLIAPQGRWRHVAEWRSVGRGDLRWTGGPARTPARDAQRPAASPTAGAPFDVTTSTVGGVRTTVIRERATGRTWRFDASTGRWVEATRGGAADEGSLGEGLVASLPLASDVSDAGGRASAVSRGGVTFADGEARFDGSGWLELPHVALNGRAHAFSMWIRPEGESNVMGLVEQRDANAGNRHYHLMLRGNSQPYLGFYLNDLAAPDALTHGEEHHVVFQFTGAKQQIWVDGALVAERASSAYEGTTGETRIGRNPSWTNVGGTHFIGAMRNVRVYDRALAPAEVGEIRRREGRTDPRAAKATLVFDGPIDGSERVVITAKEARWENVFWGVSRGVFTLNGVEWEPRKSAVLPNSGPTRFLPAGVDLTKARIVSRDVRDYAAIEVEGGRLVLRFVDSPNGAARYRVVVAFD